MERAFEISHQNSERRGITEELEELQRDMVELNQVLSMLNRYTVKDTILAEINLISAKMESLREQTTQYSNKEPLWSDIVARKKKPPTTNHHKPQQIPVINPSAWSDGHCPHTVNIACRGVTGTARMLHALTHLSISRQVREQM